MDRERLSSKYGKVPVGSPTIIKIVLISNNVVLLGGDINVHGVKGLTLHLYILWVVGLEEEYMSD
jgi:hypothetical protein